MLITLARRRDGQPLVCMSGKAHSENADIIRQAVIQADSRGDLRVELDLFRVESMDLAAAEAVRAAVEQLAGSCQLVVVKASSPARARLVEVGLSHLLGPG